jgi:hypothetical protein
LPWAEIYHGPGAPLINDIAEQWGRDTLDGLKRNLQVNPYYPFVTRQVDKSIQCRIKMRGMMMYYDKVLKEENTSLRFPRVKNDNRVPKLAASMPEV